MRIILMLATLIVVTCLAAAQESGTLPSAKKPAATTASKPGTKSQPKTSANDKPVITIDNLCSVKPPQGRPCKTVVTKEEFDRILNSVRPGLPPQARMQIAQSYAELLNFAMQAEKLGLDKRADVQEQMKLRRLQTLAVAYNRYLQEKFSKPSDAELEAYYNKNKAAYEEVTLKRIFIPKPTSTGEKRPPLDEAATKALADKTRERAVSGEDFEKLQQETYVAANPDTGKSAIPSAAMGARRRGTLAGPQEEQIFALKPGEVSPVFEEPTGFFIYKVDSKRVLPFSDVKAQISRQLEQQKMQDAVAKVTGSVKTTFDRDYFSPSETAKPAAPGTPAPESVPSGEGSPASNATLQKGSEKPQASPAATPSQPQPGQQQQPPASGAQPK